MFALTILGNNSALPAYGRHPTAQVLQNEDCNFLIDCGEGTQSRLSECKIKRSKIECIFISHLHGDHYFGLIGLLTSMSLLDRVSPLHLYAPATLKQIIDIQLQAADSILSYPVHFHALEEMTEPVSHCKTSISFFKVNHRIPCWGFVFREIKNPRKIDVERTRIYEIPYTFFDNLQKGEDFKTAKGTIVPNNEVTTAAEEPHSYAYSADTRFDENIAPFISGVDLLYHETTYLKERHEMAFARYHSTTEQAAEMAKMAGVKKLLIGHFSSKYEKLDQFLEEAKAIFPNTEIAEEGCCFQIGV